MTTPGWDQARAELRRALAGAGPERAQVTRRPGRARGLVIDPAVESSSTDIVPTDDDRA